MIEKFVTPMSADGCKVAAWRTPGSNLINYRFYACRSWGTVETLLIRESERHLPVREIAAKDWLLSVFGV